MLAPLAGRAFATSPPNAPVTINVIDVAGNLALTQAAFEAYKAAKPNFVSKITFTQSPAPELPAKIKAQQDAGRLDIDLVLTGTDALAAGIEQDLWTELLPASRNESAGARRHLPARGGQDADPGARPGRCRHLLPLRPAARIHARRA